MNCHSILRIVLILLLGPGLCVSALSQTMRPGFVDPVDDFASQLAAARSEQERVTLLATKKDLVTARLSKVLIQKGNVLLTAGQYAKAFDIYVAAKQVSEQIGDKDGIAVALLDIGTVYFLQANYNSALDHYKQARELFVQVGNKYEAAKALSGVALIHKEQHREMEALRFLNQVLQEFEALSDKEEMANTLASIGSIYYDQRKFSEAAAALLRSSELNSSAGNTGRIGDAFYMQGDYSEAAKYYKKSLASLEAQNEPAALTSALAGAANSAYYLGNYDEALEYFQRNVAVQARLQDKAGLASSLRGIGNVHRNRGDFGAALENYQQSLSLLEQLKTARGTLLSNIGIVRVLQGKNAQALDYYRQALAEFQATDNKIDMARALSLIGNVHYAQQNYDLALDSYRNSLALRESMDDKPGVGDLLLGIGTVYLSKRAFPEALDSYQKALTLFESIDYKEAAAHALSKTADTFLQQANYTEALNFANRAATLAKQIKSDEVLWYARLLSGKAQRGLDRQSDALQSFIEATAIVESLRSQPAPSETGAYRSGVLPYLAAVDLLVDLNRVVEAFDYAERAKVQSLVELLRRGNALSVKSMSAAEQAEERKLTGAALTLDLLLEREMLSRMSSETRRAALRNRLDEARSSLARFRQRLYFAHPALKVERGELAGLQLEQLRPLLNDGRTALLEYVLTESSGYLFVLTAGETARKSSGHRSSTGSAINLKVYPLAVTPEMVAQRTTSLYQSLPNRDDSFHPISSELYNWLVKPAEQQLAGKSNLIIIPHGILWHLPFEALQASADRYLLDQVSISYAPSFSSLREMIKQRRPTTRRRSGNSVGLLAFGDPTLSQELLQRIELTYENFKFDRSPEQDSEVQKVKALYGDANSRVFTGVNASEERAKTELARAGLLHFAAPAILDDISPMYSFVALASGGAGQSDGLFQPGEIIHLQTSARLAVLSAASRRLDQTGTGAAPIGLAWSWFVAGTPSVVCSRWEVRSPATSRLMFEFHSRLKASGRPASLATALQQSALTLRHSADYKHPYYWANFSLLGKGK